MQPTFARGKTERNLGEDKKDIFCIYFELNKNVIKLINFHDIEY